jgi:hypothetical protein
VYKSDESDVFPTTSAGPLCCALPLPMPPALLSFFFFFYKKHVTIITIGRSRLRDALCWEEQVRFLRHRTSLTSPDTSPNTQIAKKPRQKRTPPDLRRSLSACFSGCGGGDVVVKVTCG